MCLYCCFCFFKQKTAYEMRISDWSSDVCSSDLRGDRLPLPSRHLGQPAVQHDKSAHQLHGEMPHPQFASRHLADQRETFINERFIKPAPHQPRANVGAARVERRVVELDRKSTRLNSSH